MFWCKMWLLLVFLAALGIVRFLLGTFAAAISSACSCTFERGRWFGFWLGGASSLAGHGRGRVCFSFARCILRTDTGAWGRLNGGVSN
jgi:hypothetical protein